MRQLRRPGGVRLRAGHRGRGVHGDAAAAPGHDARLVPGVRAGGRVALAGVRTAEAEARVTGAPFTYGSVCSGIEAASVAWEPLGWKAAFFSEIEAFPRAVLAHRWPGVKCHGDFTTIREKQYDPVDLLVGGTPCQSFSVAGLRGGLADERGNLALEYLRLAGRLRPSWLLWENVPGVLSSNGGRDFGAFLGGLGQLGYGFAYRVLDAQYFGLAQRRKRVFVVGYLGDWRRAAAVLFEPTSLRRDTPPRQKTRVRTSASSPSSFGGYRDGCGTLRANEGDYGSGTETLITPLAFGGGNRSGSIDVAAACLDRKSVV